MNDLQADLKRRLLFLFHRGFVEARNLAYAGRHEQIADLADAFEPLPLLLENWREDYLEQVKSNLRTYQEKYPGLAYDYLVYLDRETVPEPI